MTGSSGKLARLAADAEAQIYLQLAAGQTAIVRTDAKEQAGDPGRI